MLYEPGETAVLIADIFPASISPYPPELPHRHDGTPQGGLMFRILITERGLVVAWQAGGQIQRVDLPMSEADIETATYQGGLAGPYGIKQAGGCRCKAKMLQSWDRSQIFPGVSWGQRNTVDLARAQAGVDKRRDSTYGLPSRRDTPTRYSRA